jgi:hypothetical protein
VGRIGNLAAVRVDSTRSIVLGAGRPFVATIADVPPAVNVATDTASAAGAVVAAPAVDVAAPRGSLIGNVLAARGASSAVQVFAAGECLFSDNRVEARTGRVAAVVLSTPVAIVNANRVRGGEPSMQIAATAKSAAVLGNITTGAIVISGGLQPPWDALNLRA